MNKKHFIITTTAIFVVISIIVFLIPVRIKNNSSFIFTYIFWLLFNIISIFFIETDVKKDLKQEIYGISIFYIWGIFNLIFIAFLFITKFIFINTYISIIIILVMILMYGLLLYSLILSKNFINQKEINNNQKTKKVKQWVTKIEIILNNNKNNRELNSLYELVRYMDPISVEDTINLDEKIEDAIENLEKSISTENIEIIEKLLNERKIIIKNTK